MLQVTSSESTHSASNVSSSYHVLNLISNLQVSKVLSYLLQTLHLPSQNLDSQAIPSCKILKRAFVPFVLECKEHPLCNRYLLKITFSKVRDQHTIFLIESRYYCRKKFLHLELKLLLNLKYIFCN